MDKNKAIIRAQRLAQKGYISKAISEYLKILRLDPKDIIVRLRLGDLYAKSGENEKAIDEYMEVAKIHSQRGFSLKAIAVYKQILKLNDELIDVHLKLAELYKRQSLMVDAMHHYAYVINSYEKEGAYDEIVPVLKSLVEVEPENLSIRVRLILNQFRIDKREEAVELIKETSQMLLSKQSLDKLERFCQRLLEEGIREEDVYRGLIEVHKEKGERDSLLDTYRGLMALYEERGEKDKVEEVRGEISKIESSEMGGEGISSKCEAASSTLSVPELKEDTPAHGFEIERGEASETIEAPETVGEIGAHASESPPATEGKMEEDDLLEEAEVLGVLEEGEDPETHYNMGIAYMEMELFEEAIKEFNISLHDPSFRFESYNRLGLCLVAMGRYAEACEFFEKGLNLPGRSENEYNGLTYEMGLAYELSGDLKKALELFKRVEERDSGFRDVSKRVSELSQKTNQ